MDRTQPRTTRARPWRRLRVWWRRLPVLELTLTAGLVLLGGLLIAHMLEKPVEPYVRALGAIDATLRQNWGSLPTSVQEQLRATYQHLGLVPPGQRQ